METYVNLTRSQTLLYYFASFIGVAPFSIENNILRPVSCLHKVYALISIVLTSLWIIILHVYYPSSALTASSVNRFAFIMFITLHVGYMWLTRFILTYKSSKITDLIIQMTAIREELKNLGIENDYKKYRRNFYGRIIATNIIVLVMSVITNIAHNNNDYYIGFKVISWFASILISIHLHNAILIFVETLICIRQLFESLNNKLLGTVTRDYDLFTSYDVQNSTAFTIGRGQRIGNRVAHRIITEYRNIHLSVGDVEKIAYFHRELCDLVESTTDLYTVLILFAILQHVSKVLSNFYAMYLHVLGFGTTKTVTLLVLQFVARVTISMMDLFLIAHACTSICRVGNATRSVVHEVWNKFYPEELRDELYRFSLQLLHEPVAVTAFGFFDLGYSYLYKIFCALVTYFIIMIQFDTSPANPNG